MIIDQKYFINCHPCNHFALWIRRYVLMLFEGLAADITS